MKTFERLFPYAEREETTRQAWLGKTYAPPGTQGAHVAKLMREQLRGKRS